MRIVYFTILCFLINVPISAQANEALVYLLTETQDDYQIVAFNPVDNHSEILFDTPKTQQGILSQVFPSDESDALAAYLSTRSSHADLSQTQLNISIRALSVSPDNTQVIAIVTYERQYNPHQPRFGTTQLILISRDDGRQRVLFNLGFHDTRYLTNYSTRPYLLIHDVQWTPNQQAVIISIADSHYRTSPPQFSILEISIGTNSVTKISEGITWAVSPTSDQIVILQARNRLPNTLTFVDIAHPAQAISHELGAWSIDTERGLAYWGSFIVFSVAYDGMKHEGGGGFAMFNTLTDTASILLPEQFITRIESSPDGAHLILETSQGSLLEVQEIDGAIQIAPMLAK